MTGTEFKALRNLNRFTQADLAKKMGVSKDTLISWENKWKDKHITEAYAKLVVFVIRQERGKKWAQGLKGVKP
jgi:DNA-binding XRE family transcriptional regulator